MEAVVTDDDVAVQDSLYTAGRRGVGITVLAEKIVGAAAEEGKRPRRGDRAVPAGERRGPQHGHGAHLVHGPGGGQAHVRAGRRRDGDRHRHPRRARSRAHEARVRARHRRAPRRAPIIDDLPFASGDRVLAFVNGMGGTPLLELYLVYGELRTLLADRGIEVARSLVGSYITSLEMAGCSITLLRLDDEMIRLWDAPVHTAGLRWGA